MIRFALIVASVLGFALTAAVGNLLTPLLRALVPPEKENAPDPKPGQDPPEPSAPRGLPTMGGLCFIVVTPAPLGCSRESWPTYSALRCRAARR